MLLQRSCQTCPSFSLRENQHDENILTQQSQYPFSFCLQRMSSGYPAIVKTHLLLREVLEDHKIQIKVPSHLSFQTVSLHSQRRQFVPPKSRSECKCASKPEKNMTTTQISLRAHQPCGRPQHHLRNQASCSFRLLSLLT